MERGIGLDDLGSWKRDDWGNLFMIKDTTTTGVDDLPSWKRDDTRC